MRAFLCESTLAQQAAQLGKNREISAIRAAIIFLKITLKPQFTQTQHSVIHAETKYF
jgi:hypothetical protein